ncbi:acyl carrier protein [Streptomyces sp. NPDC052095]|uniref:acyl carrier protein n=1 Tax=unclassified Streptomyces TaxID=2593676 RepID=UPI00344F9886
MTSRTPWLQGLFDIPPSECRTFLESLVVAEFERELMTGEEDVLPLQVSCFEIGTTSLGVVETRRRLEQETGRPLDSTFLFNHPAVRDLVEFLTTEVVPGLFSAAAPGPKAQQDAEVSTKNLVNDVLKELHQWPKRPRPAPMPC